MSRPCSSQVYQVTPTPASCASSSRRSPGVRRRPMGVRPTCCGAIRSRRSRRNAPSSRRRSSAVSLVSTVRTTLPSGPHGSAAAAAASVPARVPLLTMPPSCASFMDYCQVSVSTRITRLLVPGYVCAHAGCMTSGVDETTRPATIAPAPAEGQPAALTTLGLMTVLIGVFLPMTDFFIVNVALPTIDRALHAPAGMLQLVVAGYAIAYALLLVVGGRIGDAGGRKRRFLIGLAGVTGAALARG